MKRNFLLIAMLIMAFNIKAQQFITRAGNAVFFSSTPLEDIRAENRQVYGVVDIKTKQVAVSMLMKGFEFKKELMQTHFNENYVESDKFPKATFIGTFTEKSAWDPNVTNDVSIEGSLTMHGVTKIIKVPAKIKIQNGQLLADAGFSIIPEDFKISIPSLVRENIAKEIHITIHLSCLPKN